MVEAAPQETLTLTPEAWLPGAAKVFALARPGGEPKALERLRPQQNQAGNQVVVTVLNTDEMPQPGLKVYAFDGAAYTNYSATTDANGQAVFTLPQGEYRFRADFNGTQFWSGTENHCQVPDCATASITVTVPLTLTVQDTDGAASAGLKVYAFNGATYSNFSATTDEDGQAVFILPQGDYRFRADFNGTQFWSGTENHCTIPDCASAAITVSKPVTVTVAGQGGQPYSNLPVYAFDGTRYTGYSAMTDASGKATFTLPLGEYRFRADYDGVQFWSAETNTCPSPGCEAASVTLPGGTGEMSVTIDYEYDPLNRLTRAAYSDGRVYEYTYDAVGNRLSQTIIIDGLSATTNYQYDAANRLTSVGGVTYTYDNNGNLLSDGANTYSYDAANRLISVTGSQKTVTYAYNGLGDRLQETVDGVTTTFTMDLNTGLTQALSDGERDYLYGAGRIAQSPITQSPNHQMEYFLGDALGSVRQLTDSTGAVTLARTYDPYGTVNTTSGSSSSSYGFTSEYQSGDSVYLRSRFYTPSTGRFLTRDTWSGNANRPLSFNRWGYVEGNPVNLTDPTGMRPTNPPTPLNPSYSLSIYCVGLSGKDRLYCERIVRGINPEAEVPLSELIMSDYYDGCYIKNHYSNLYKDLPHSVYDGTWKEYGWWYHYLLENTPGWWNNNGNGHIKFSDVLAFTLAVELSSAAANYPELPGYAAGALANKGREMGFYNMIGSRQSVFTRINHALYGPTGQGYYNFKEYGNSFSKTMESDQVLASPMRTWGENVLYYRNFTSQQKLAYEWGNPTNKTPDNLPLLGALQPGNMGVDRLQVLYFAPSNVGWQGKIDTPSIYDEVSKTTVYKIEFVLTKDQMNALCNNASCVSP